MFTVWEKAACEDGVGGTSSTCEHVSRGTPVPLSGTNNIYTGTPPMHLLIKYQSCHRSHKTSNMFMRLFFTNARFWATTVVYQCSLIFICVFSHSCIAWGRAVLLCNSWILLTLGVHTFST